ncbi:MAG TPA: ATP-binding protein [Desulfitobacteriaceae bacterium]|nr:ATP-binding protein [Desulfitobacteriaceae bacterium]
MDSFDFLNHNPHLKQILMKSKLPDIIPGGFSIATDVTCERIIHNPVTAEFLRIGPWEQLSFSSPEPLPVKAYQNGRLFPASKMPMQQAAQFGKVIVGCEIEFVWEDGISKIARWNAIPLRNESGIICGSIATMNDITEIVHLAREQEMNITEYKKTEERLERRNRRITEILNSIQEIFYALDRNWNFLYASKSFTSKTGKEPENFIGKNIWDMLPKYIGTVFEENVRSVMNNGEVRRFELEDQDAGSYYQMAVFPSPEGITLLGTDITEHKKTDEFLKQSEQHALALVEELKKADQNKNRFLNNLSHELRNPLASIMMSLSLLKRVAPDSEQAWQANNILERQTIQLSRLVDDLLDMTRISQNKIVLKKELVELNNLVSKTAEDYKTMFNEKEVNLKAEIFPEPIYLPADPSRLTQVIGNLLHNAHKFTKPGGETRIIISKSQTSNEAVIEIIDNGLGIKPVLLPDLFEPFVQAENSLDHSHGGLGLGLAIVKGIVDLHGGNVSADSQGLGKGAQFAIRLPLLQDKDDKQKEHLPKNGEINRSLRIMVIDDIPDVVEILSSLLQLLGHEVTSAANRPEGLAKVMKFAPEVIICDIGLPEMNGYEIARHIRNDHSLNKIFLIALSGYAQADDLATALESGFDRHLAKPVDLETLEKILTEVP